MRPTHRHRGVPDPSSPAPLSGAFSLHTRPAVSAPESREQRWDRWTDWDIARRQAESGQATKDGVPVRVSEPMGAMDPGGRVRGRSPLVISARAQRALAELPLWRRILARFLFAIGAFIGRVDRGRLPKLGSADKHVAKDYVRVDPRPQPGTDPREKRGSLNFFRINPVQAAAPEKGGKS